MTNHIRNAKLASLWNNAFKNPGEPQFLGRIVVCDDCDADWTDRPESGGLIYGSHAVCPDCEKKTLEGLKKYNELHLIVGVCPAGMSFGDFVRRMRGPGAAITVRV